MSLPSIVSYGAAAKTSSLVWDGDLVIPDGYAIESASGEVGIVGDVSVSGSLSAGNSVQGHEKLASALVTATNASITRLNGKNMTTISISSSGVSPITTSSTATTFTVSNPYAGNMSGKMTVVGLSSMYQSNRVYIDGKWAGQANEGETATWDVMLSPGNHTVTQIFNCKVSFNCDTLSFSAFV